MAILPRPFAFEHPALLRLGKPAPRNIGGDIAPAREAHQVALALAIAFCLPGFDRTLRQGFALVRYDEGVIDSDDSPEAAA